MRPTEEAFTAAAQFREHHRLGLQPLGDLVSLIEQATGIDVAVLDVDDTHEHGLTVRDPERDVMFMGVARTPQPMRQRSTLAHELAHLVFNDWADYGGGNWDRRSHGEMRADAFAGHLLIPRQGLREYLDGRLVDDPAVLSDVVQWFLVSPQMALIAMAEMNLVDAATKDAWWQYSTPRLAAQFGWADQYQALQMQSQKSRAPQKLLRRAIAGYRDSVVSAQAIATLRGIEAADAKRELREAGIIPVSHDDSLDDDIQVPTVPWDLPELDEFGGPGPGAGQDET